MPWNIELYPDGIQMVYHLDTQVRLGKDRLGKVRLGEDMECAIEEEILGYEEAPDCSPATTDATL